LNNKGGNMNETSSYNLSADEQRAVLERTLKKNNFNIPMRECRFPLLEGLQQSVTLKSNVTGYFMNIYFTDGVDNTINGNIADRLLDDYPEIFKIIKVNGIEVSQGKQDSQINILKQEIIRQIKEDYDLVIKDKKPIKRDRINENKPEPIVKDNSYDNDTISSKKSSSK